MGWAGALLLCVGLEGGRAHAGWFRLSECAHEGGEAF